MWIDDGTDATIALKETRRAAVAECIQKLNNTVGKQFLLLQMPEDPHAGPCVPIEFSETKRCYGFTNTRRWKHAPNHLSRARIVISEAITEQAALESTICHEMGHALGLGHVQRDAGCKRGDTEEMMESGCGARMKRRGYRWLIGKHTSQRLSELYGGDEWGM